MNNLQDTGALIPFPDPVIFLKNPVRSRFVFQIGKFIIFQKKSPLRALFWPSGGCQTKNPPYLTTGRAVPQMIKYNNNDRHKDTKKTGVASLRARATTKFIA